MQFNYPVNTKRVQYIAIVVSVFFIFFIIELIRRKKIKEEYSILWLFFGMIFLAFSIWRNGLEIISRLMGIAYPPAAIFLLLIIAFFTLLIHFSVIISKLSESNKNLIQSIGILEMELREIKKNIDNRLLNKSE